MSYNYNFDDGGCRRDAVIDRKAYNTNQGSGMEVWMEDIVQLASRWRVGKAGILLLQMLL